MRPQLTTSALAVVAILAACASVAPTATLDRTEDSIASSEVTTNGAASLPEREGPRRETTGDVPHIQLDGEVVPDVDAELRRRVFQLPGVEDRPSDRSLPGARGLAFADGFEVARRDVIAGSREFAHIHPDGSLHVWAPVELALEVDRAKWGELHPWVERDGFWDGVVMVFTPETLEEVEVVVAIVVDAYNFVTGAGVKPDDIP